MTSLIAPSSSISQATSGHTIPIFYDFMVQSYPDADTLALSNSPRKRRTKGAVRYTCKFCSPEWYSPYKANATGHIKTTHNSIVPINTHFQ